MNDSSCAEFEPLLTRAADGDLDAASMARVDRHVAACAGCREALAAQRAVHHALTAAHAWSAPEAFEARVMAGIHGAAAHDPGVASRMEQWTAAWDLRRWSWRLAPIAAAVALATIYSIARIDPSGTASTASADSTTAAAPATAGLPVSAAIWSGAVSDTSLLSLLVHADVDDPLSKYVKEHQP